ncbi:hypothetical protein Tco_0760335 [Tanacetum coccineum]
MSDVNITAPEEDHPDSPVIPKLMSKIQVLEQGLVNDKLKIKRLEDEISSHESDKRALKMLTIQIVRENEEKVSLLVEKLSENRMLEKLDQLEKEFLSKQNESTDWPMGAVSAVAILALVFFQYWRTCLPLMAKDGFPIGSLVGEYESVLESEMKKKKEMRILESGKHWEVRIWVRLCLATSVLERLGATSETQRTIYGDGEVEMVAWAAGDEVVMAYGGVVAARVMRRGGAKGGGARRRLLVAGGGDSRRYVDRLWWSGVEMAMDVTLVCATTSITSCGRFPARITLSVIVDIQSSMFVSECLLIIGTGIQEKQESIIDNEVGDEAEEIYKDEVMDTYTKLKGGRTDADEAKATSSKNVTSGGVHNEGVTSWYIDIGDCDCSYEHCGARF